MGFCALGAQGRVFRNRDASRRIKSLSKEKTTRSGRAPLQFRRNKPSCSAGSPEPKAKIPREPSSPHHLSHGDLSCTHSHNYSFSIERTKPKSSNEFFSSPPKTKHGPVRSRAVLGGRRAEGPLRPPLQGHTVSDNLGLPQEIKPNEGLPDLRLTMTEIPDPQSSCGNGCSSHLSLTHNLKRDKIISPTKSLLRPSRPKQSLPAESVPKPSNSYV